MGCNQSAAANVTAAPAAPPPAPFSPVKQKGASTVPTSDDGDEFILLPAFDDAHTDTYCGTSSEYIDISEELSKLIALHNSVEHIVLDNAADVHAVEPVELTPEEEKIKKEHTIEKLQKVHATRAVVHCDADMETLEIHENVRAQLCEFFSK